MVKIAVKSRSREKKILRVGWSCVGSTSAIPGDLAGFITLEVTAEVIINTKLKIRLLNVLDN